MKHYIVNTDVEVEALSPEMAEDLVLVAVLGDVPDDEEVPGKFELLDDVRKVYGIVR